MRYIKVAWHHDHANEPIWLYSECDDAGWGVRKVEVFRNGRMGYASGTDNSGCTGLGTEPVPSSAEIADDPQFQPFEIAREDFERIWAAAQPVAA